MNRSGFQISSFLVILAVLGCHRPPEFPVVPQISFERLHLTDTATLILDFSITDGDGDIGLDEYELEEPFHPYSIILQNDTIVNISGVFTGPFDMVPAGLFPVTYRLFKGLDENGNQTLEDVTVLAPFRVGEEVDFSIYDSRPSSGYECEQYEIISFYNVVQEIENEVVLSESLVEEIDTVFVQRNPYHFNIYIDILVKDGENYFAYQDVFPELIAGCDPLFTSRFPVFDRSDIGRPLDGYISYAFFSTQFATENSLLLSETLRLRFYIYDRGRKQSNIVETEDFTILGLRSGDLVGN